MHINIDEYIYMYIHMLRSMRNKIKKIYISLQLVRFYSDPQCWSPSNHLQRPVWLLRAQGFEAQFFSCAELEHGLGMTGAGMLKVRGMGILMFQLAGRSCKALHGLGLSIQSIQPIWQAVSLRHKSKL